MISRITRWLPWRLASAGWLTALAVLGVGVPLFVRMPLWCDATLYDVAAYNVLSGGVHYRDVFDTNPPGFVWLLCGVRSVLGWSPEALRAVDLAVVLAISVLLLRWAKEAGADAAGLAWTAAAVAAFYPFTTEFNHAQRDVWMMLPALLAVRYRMRRIEAARSSAITDGQVLRSGVLEGIVWGLGFWIKPHVAVPAIAVWAVGARRFARTSGRPVRRLAADLLGVFTGGLGVGLAGVGWLVGTGTWPHFLDVFTRWNTSYLRMIFGELGSRFLDELCYFPPWSLCLLAAVPLAARNLRDRSADPAGFSRAVLAGLFLGWAGMALFLQRGFHYVHVPEVLLMLAVFAANRWAAAFALIAFQTAVGLLLTYPGVMEWHRTMREEHPVYACVVERHPAFDRVRTGWWPGCFDADPPRELRRGVGLQTDHFGGIDPVELGAVEDYLRAQNVADRDVICWHSTTHPLYLSLRLRPAIRFMHLSTVMEIGPWQYEQVREELFAATPRARFAVSDMHRITTAYDRLNEVGPDGLPALLPAWQRGQFPFNQPVVFRSPSGRYLVHAIRHPAEKWDCKIPRFVGDTEPW
jgi:hypothetical protein